MTVSLANIFEALMIICFGISWPINVIKGLKSRSTKGKSILFDYFVLTGYFCGLTAKFMTQNFNLAFYFYFPNILMVITDIVIYHCNKARERAQTVK